MPSELFDIDCGDGEIAIVEWGQRYRRNSLIIHGWDSEADFAAVELGFEPSRCFRLWEATRGKIPEEALQLCIDNNDTDTCKIMIEAGVDISCRNHEALRRAAYRGNYELVAVLLEEGADVHANDDEPLLHAADLNYLDIAELLIAHGANIHAGKEAALIAAAEAGNAEVLELLINAGAAVGAQNNAALLGAVRECSSHQTVELLLEAGADVYAHNYKIFDYAIGCGDSELDHMIRDWARWGQ